MASQLTGKDFWGLVQHILPFYIILLIAYGFAKKNILQKMHAPGLSRWTSLVGIPIYVGRMLAFNDPYAINLRLVGADVLQKVVVLIVAGVWWRFSRHGNIDGVITFFMLATLSNMVLVGPALFQPLHGESSKVSIATIIILQCALWYNLCIVLFETRVVLKEMNGKESSQTELQLSEQGKHSLKTFPVGTILSTALVPRSSPLEVEVENEKYRGSNSPIILTGRLQRTTSAPARVSFSIARVLPFPIMLMRTAQVDEQEGDETAVVCYENKAADSGCDDVHGHHLGGPSKAGANLHDDDRSVAIDISESGIADGPESQRTDSPRMNRLTYVKTVSYKVVNRVKYAPLTYTSIVGFAYSLLAFRYDWEMPYPIKTSVELVANGAIAISVVTMALTWADSGRLISCGIRKMAFGFVLRFLIGPIIMACSSLAFGLTGIAFEFAVLQAALPVGLVSFVLAKEYNLDVEVFSTAVITQLVIFLPLVVVYYFILQPIGI